MTTPGEHNAPYAPIAKTLSLCSPSRALTRPERHLPRSVVARGCSTRLPHADGRSANSKSPPPRSAKPQRKKAAKKKATRVVKAWSQLPAVSEACRYSLCRAGLRSPGSCTCRKRGLPGTRAHPSPSPAHAAFPRCCPERVGSSFLYKALCSF